MNTNIQKVADDLFLIPLNLSMTGFTQFISAWLYRGHITCLIDVGPSTTAADLLRSLQALNIGQLDYILLTHIHLDHGGAIGEIANAFPQTPIVCHPAGIPHLIEPSQLWQATKKVLGTMAVSYGPIKPVSGDRFLESNKFQANWVTPIATPGHAVHHVSYQIRQYLFAGETGGVYLSLPKNKFYLRPATPPKFFLETATQSLDALIACDADMICYGHFGTHQDAVDMLQIHRRQLLFWADLIKEEIQNGRPEDRMAACLIRLLENDPLMATFDQLPPDIQKRERYFLQNSINGYLGYLDPKE